MAQTSPDLTKAINRENDRLIKANTKELPKYDYPMNVITAAMIACAAHYALLESAPSELSLNAEPSKELAE